VLTFAIAATRSGRPFGPTELESLQKRAASQVPFAPGHSVTWTNDAGTIWFGAWQASGRGGGATELRWHVDDEGITAFAGRAWPRRDEWVGSTPQSVQLAAYLRRQPLVDNADALAGVYAIASIARVGRCTVAADPLGIAPLHWGQTDGVVVVSTRASMAAALLIAGQGTTPKRDALGTAWLAYAGQVLGGDTGYEQVRLVPEGSVVEIDGRGAVGFRGSVQPPWRLGADDLAKDPEAALEDAQWEMTTAIRTALREPGGNGKLGLTGGKDSRLVLALLLADGSIRDVECQTLGSADLPDVVVARQLAHSFGLRHVTNPAMGDHGAWHKRVDDAVRDGRLAQAHTREIAFRITAWATSGARNVGEPYSSRLPPSDTVLLSGLCGEALRTNYHHSTKLRSKEQAARFPDQVGFGGSGILCGDAAAWYRTRVHELLFEGAQRGDSPQDIIDSFYLRHRLRRWLGPTQEVDAQNRVFPLYSITGIRLGFAIGAENRHAEWIHYRLMRSACEPLVYAPFGAGGWPPGADGELASPSRYDDPIPEQPPRRRPRDLAHDRLAGFARRVMQPAPVRHVAREFRAKVRATDVEIMRRLLRHDTANPAFEIIDATAAQRALDRFDVLPEMHRLQLFGALSAVIWLGGHEVELPRHLNDA
jgi:hypothetical protein